MTPYRQKKRATPQEGQLTLPMIAVDPVLGDVELDPTPWAAERPTLSSRFVRVSRMFPWSFRQLLSFVEGFFEASLKSLGSADPAERQDVMSWVFEPPVLSVLRGDTLQHVRTELVPWSFRWCCALLGYDADALQSGVEAQVKVESSAHSAPTVPAVPARPGTTHH